MVDYCTLAEIKASLPDSLGSDTSYDALLTVLATRASRAIDRYTKRYPGAYLVSSATTRYYTGSSRLELLTDEFVGSPLISVAESGDIDNASGSGGIYTVWSSSDYYLYPLNASDQGQPFTSIIIDALNGTKSTWFGFNKGVKILALWGYSNVIPEEIKEISIIQAVRWFKRGQQAFEDLSAVPNFGQLVSLRRLDQDIEFMIEHFMRTTI